MGGCVITTGNRHIVHKMRINRQKLEQIADILGISQAERHEILSGGESIHVYAGARPTPGAPPSPGATPSPGAPPSPPGGGRRQRK
jgi:hypothetical protein